MSSKIAGSGAFAFVLVQASVTLSGSLTLSTRLAHAQASTDAALAQSLFDEGRKLMAEKKYAEACPRLERSYKLDPATGTLLNVAVCHESVGRIATASSEFRDVLAFARRENRDDRLKFAQSHLDSLKDRISTLTVKQAKQEAGLEWKIDGAKVGTEALGIAVPIDPGAHIVEAAAPGKKPWKVTIEIRKDGETKSIEIPTLDAEDNGRALEKSRGPSPWLYVAVGFGVVGFGAMAVGGIESLSSWSDRKAGCGIGGDPNACTQAGIDADKTARTWAIVADVGLGVGVVGAVATVIIAVVGRGKSKEAPARVSISPVLTPRWAGVTLGAAF